MNCHSSVTAETEQLWLDKDALFVGLRKLLDGRCQNVIKPHKQELVPSQLAGKAEKKTNRQAVCARQANREADSHSGNDGTDTCTYTDNNRNIKMFSLHFCVSLTLSLRMM